MKKSKRNRNQLIKIFGKRYKRLKCLPEDESSCFYCGDFVEVIDHCPPLKWCEFQDIEWWDLQKIPWVLVKSCKQCNLFLGDKPLFSVYERALFIEKLLLKKYEKASKTWKNEEIEEMGPSLKQFIFGQQRKNEELLRRVRFAQERVVKVNSFPDWDEQKCHQ